MTASFNQTITDIDEPTDTVFQFGLVYDVFFVDFGNKQSNTKSSQICSIEHLVCLNEKLRIVNDVSIQTIVSNPFQAQCCQMDMNSVACTNFNTRAFQTFVDQNSFFNVRLVSEPEPFELLTNRDGARIDAYRYTVSLISTNDGSELIEKLEKLNKKVEVVEHKFETKIETTKDSVATAKKISQQVEEDLLTSEKELKINEIYTCRFAYFNDKTFEIFINLEEDFEKMVRPLR